MHSPFLSLALPFRFLQVEDDMVAFKGREADKLAHLRAFHK